MYVQVLRGLVKQFKVKSVSSFLALRLDFVFIHVVWSVLCCAGEEKYLSLLPFWILAGTPITKDR